jgi:hypothetical protein
MISGNVRLSRVYTGARVGATPSPWRFVQQVGIFGNTVLGTTCISTMYGANQFQPLTIALFPQSIKLAIHF